MTGAALVTGASGFLGRHLLEGLRAASVPAVAFCRRPEPISDLAGDRLRPVAGDLRDDDAVARALLGIDTVYHLAALRNLPGTRPDEMREVNETATLRLAGRALEAGVRRFVHVSTALVFGPSAAPLDLWAPLVLDDGVAGPYVASKARAVAALRKLRGEGAPIAIVHPAIVYGPDHPSRPNRVTAEIRRLLRRPLALLVDGGRAERDVVHVGDVVAALLAARAEGAAGELVAAAGPVSHRRLAGLVRKSAGRRPPLLVSVPETVCRVAARIADRARGRDPALGSARAVWTAARSWRFSPEAFRASLGREPVAVERGVAETVAWVLQGEA